MKPVEFDEVNVTLQKPEGMTDEECQPLPICRTTDGYCVSCWELTENEIEELKKTRRVFLGVFSGATQPPVFLSVANPVRTKQEDAR